MKRQFSTSWISSTQPRKQRKFRANAPLHKKHRFLSANLSKELRKKYGKRNLPLRKGDEVLVMRGKFAKKKVKVSSVNLKLSKVYLEGLNPTKKDGTKVNISFYPSRLQIQSLNLEDKERSKKLGENKATETKENKNASNKKSSNN